MKLFSTIKSYNNISVWYWILDLLTIINAQWFYECSRWSQERRSFNDLSWTRVYNRSIWPDSYARASGYITNAFSLSFTDAIGFKNLNETLDFILKWKM